jgi:RimJ/RimL family protein N-acetyltransferase
MRYGLSLTREGGTMVRGDKIHLTNLDPANAEVSRAWINDPEVNLYLLTGQVPVSVAAEAAWYEKAVADWSAGTAYQFEIHVADDGRYIGNCGLHHVDMRNRSAEIGILIGEVSEQNRGYGSDAILTLTRFGFDTLGLNRLEIRSQADNERSMHLYERLGFKPIGRMREATYTYGRFADEALFDMLVGEWRARG